jgi:hypothetical protein
MNSLVRSALPRQLSTVIRQPLHAAGRRTVHAHAEEYRVLMLPKALRATSNLPPEHTF